MRGMRFLAGWLLGALLFPSGAWAQIYRWVDERGGVHYSEGIDSIPERHRSHALPLTRPTSSPRSLESTGSV